MTAGGMSGSLPEGSTVDLRGKTYVLYKGLLALAHERGLRGIEEEIVQAPSPDNGEVAIVRAIVRDDEGRTFCGIGDASPQNVGRNIAPHVLRMASTRAKARAMRDMCNVGVTALEEISDDDGPPPKTEPEKAAGGAPAKPEARGLGGRGAARDAKKADPAKARKSQVDLLRALAEELRGENGVERLEQRIGKKLGELTRQEADEWIDRLRQSPSAEGRE